MEKLYSTKTAAEYTSMSEGYFRKLILENKIAYLKVGKAVRIKESDLNQYIQSLAVEVTPDEANR